MITYSYTQVVIRRSTTDLAPPSTRSTMTDASEPRPEHRDDPGDDAGRDDARPAGNDLQALRAHPSLADMARRGRDLDRLPVATTAWAFIAATAGSLLLLGYLGAVVVAVGTAAGLSLVASALVHRNVATARAVLRTVALGLVGWVVMIVVVVAPAAA